MKNQLRRVAALAILAFAATTASGDEITFGSRTWQTNVTGGGPSFAVVGDSGVITGSYGPNAAMSTPISLSIGDTISYDYKLSNTISNNWVGAAFGDFRGGNIADGGYLISGRTGYQQDFSETDRALWFQDSNFSNRPEGALAGSSEDDPGVHVTWWFPTANTYQVTVSKIGSSSPTFGYRGTTGFNAITDVTFFRQELNDTLQTLAISNFTHAPAGAAGSLVFGFENGLTGDGFTNLTAPGGVTNWVASSAAIDIGNDFALLPATEGSNRIAVSPWSERDNFGSADHKTLLLRSPTFQLDGSGSLQVDMLGGMKYGENNHAPNTTKADPTNAGELGSMQRNEGFDFPANGEVNDGKHLQGFALRDALTGEYVLIGTNNGLGDGKQRPTDSYERGTWGTAMFSQADLAPFANNGRQYQIDFIDSFGEGSWAHVGFDNVRVPGTLSSFAKGDANGDGATNSADSTIVFSKFTGWRSASPVAKADGLARDDGDFDGNGDVDGGDVIEHIANIGLTAPTSGSATLIYDPTDGSVSLSAAGAAGNKITAFRLQSDDASPFTEGTATLPGVGTPITTDIASELFWADTTFAGFTGVRDLGSILAAGLNLSQVESALASAVYVGASGTGEFSFITTLAGAIDGDFNGDGAVNSTDLNDPVLGWKARFGVDLDGNDFLAWQRKFGTGMPAGAAAGAVPEPSTAILALMGIVGAMHISRRSVGGFSR